MQETTSKKQLRVPEQEKHPEAGLCLVGSNPCELIHVKCYSLPDICLWASDSVVHEIHRTAKPGAHSAEEIHTVLNSEIPGVYFNQFNQSHDWKSRFHYFPIKIE